MDQMKDLFAQAGNMQENMQKLQAELANRKVEASAGGGMVSAVASGALRVLEVRIEPSLFEGGDRGLIEDLTAAAVNAALEKAQLMVQEEVQKMAGGPFANMLGGLGGKG